MNRPLLTPDLPPETFRAWYWLKKELQDFCSAQDWPTGGSKQDLTARVMAGLSAQPLPATASKVPKGAMPDNLTPQTVIGPGWRLNAALRGFFVAHTSTAFRFNQALRDLFKHPEGRTLGQALAVYQESCAQGVTPIQRQFQFNQHIRDHFAQHPGATRAQALQAWQAKRQTPQALVFSADSE
ncbi:DUF6434 domain-containing protein [Limnohabitans sp.]|uniref:DUF6434 domain-containing protein n=1 Tax=Limnohabitans sp. TaxID=1907725 RepID=UPI0025C3CD14|nr:DUF6434 domain-containing protein [Limnohabitans sp.]